VRVAVLELASDSLKLDLGLVDMQREGVLDGLEQVAMLGRRGVRTLLARKAASLVSSASLSSSSFYSFWAGLLPPSPEGYAGLATARESKESPGRSGACAGGKRSGTDSMLGCWRCQKDQRQRGPTSAAWCSDGRRRNPHHWVSSSSLRCSVKRLCGRTSEHSFSAQT
jgi:hypothetical protein